MVPNVGLLVAPLLRFSQAIGLLSYEFVFLFKVFAPVALTGKICIINVKSARNVRLDILLARLVTKQHSPLSRLLLLCCVRAKLIERLRLRGLFPAISFCLHVIVPLVTQTRSSLASATSYMRC
jgi:hypothetical protein